MAIAEIPAAWRFHDYGADWLVGGPYYLAREGWLEAAQEDNRRKYDKAFNEALRLAGRSRSTQAVARQLGINRKLLYRWQQAQFVAEVGSEEWRATRS